MTNLITITEINVATGEDRFLVLVDGVVFTSCPNLRSASVSARLATGWRG